MNITITGRKTSIKDQFRERVAKKLSKLDRFFDDEARAVVTVTSEQHDRETVEVTITYNGMMFRAEKTTNDRTDSLDAVTDVLFKQIVKNKTKLESRMRSTAFDNLEPAETAEVESGDFELIKRKNFQVRPMEIQEAILQMNMLGHSFFAFLNPDSGDVNIVYRRQGEGYGLIEPVK